MNWDVAGPILVSASCGVLGVMLVVTGYRNGSMTHARDGLLWLAIGGIWLYQVGEKI